MGHPLMIENGLHVRGDVFGISGNRLMLFTYLWNKLFFVNVYYEKSMGLSILPSEHLFCRAMEEPKHFEVTLTNLAATGKQLVIYFWIIKFFSYLVSSMDLQGMDLYHGWICDVTSFQPRPKHLNTTPTLVCLTMGWICFVTKRHSLHCNHCITPYR